MTKKEKKLIAVIGLVVILLTACASKAANATEKIELGQKYLTEANYTEAIAAFTEVIKIDPSNIEAYMGRAEAYKGLKQYDDAKADYTEVIGKTDEMPYTQAQAYTGRAEVYELTDETTEAESDYSAAIGLLDEEDVGKKENIAEALIRELKIKVLQLHAEVCEKLGLHDKAMEDYAKLAELGVDVPQPEEESTSQAEATGGTYDWYYIEADGFSSKAQLSVQSGSDQMKAVVEYTDMSSEDMAGLVASLEFQEKYGRLDPQNMTETQLEKIGTEMEGIEQKWLGMNLKPQIIETVTLSAPVTRVEKTDDHLYIYVPTGTKFITGKMILESSGGKTVEFDMKKFVEDDAGWTQPIYNTDPTPGGDVKVSLDIKYKEAK